MREDLQELRVGIIHALGDLERLSEHDQAVPTIHWLNQQGTFFGLESCPACNTVQDSLGHRFCQHCGQRFDPTSSRMRYGFPEAVKDV